MSEDKADVDIREAPATRGLSRPVKDDAGCRADVRLAK